MATALETLEVEVSETKTAVDSAIVLIQGLKAQLDAAGTDPVKLAALSAALDASQTDLANAVVANTPVAPV